MENCEKISSQDSRSSLLRFKLETSKYEAGMLLHYIVTSDIAF